MASFPPLFPKTRALAQSAARFTGAAQGMALTAALLLGLQIPASAQAPYKYTPVQLRQMLPEPVLEDTALVSLYYGAWNVAHGKIRAGNPAAGFTPYFVDEGFTNNIFQWDTIFMMMFYRYAWHMYPTIVSLDNFYSHQHPDGLITREISEGDGKDINFRGIANTINPPVFSWAEWEHFQLTADTARLRRVLPILVKYNAWVDTGRRSADTLYWNTPLGSGMDDTPRKGRSWICMSAQMAMNAKYMAKMAQVIGDKATQSRFEKAQSEINQRINRKMWQDSAGFYFDIDSLGHYKVKTPASFWTLLAATADAPKAQRLVQHIVNPKEFWRTHVLPSLAADEPLYNKSNGWYWKGAVWAPLNYQAVRGLDEYGYDSLTLEIAKNHLNNLYASYAAPGKGSTLWENYAPDALGVGQGRSHFVGWTGCGPIAMLIENILGFSLNAPEMKVRWNLRRTDLHGMKNLRMGQAVFSALSAKRASAGISPVITVTTDKPLNFEVKWAGKEYRQSFKAGTSQWNLSTASVRLVSPKTRVPDAKKVKGDLRLDGRKVLVPGAMPLFHSAPP